jgi:hypothetical protein
MAYCDKLFSFLKKCESELAQYLWSMRSLFTWSVFAMLFSSCGKDVDDCPVRWTLDRKEIAANVAADSGQLVLTAFAPNQPNAIELIQRGLQGDFTLDLHVDGLVWDTLTEPQFRMEVVASDDVSAKPHGIAINRTTVRTYFDGGEGSSDFRIIPNDHIGSLTITRTGEQLVLHTSFGTIHLEHSADVGASELDLRLVLGNMGPTHGMVQFRAEQLTVSDGQPRVTSDEFDCPSWE